MGIPEVVLVLVLAVGVIGFGVTALVYAVKASAARAASTIDKRDREALEQVVKALTLQQTDEIARREAVIAQLRATIAATEKELEASTDPAAARERLRRMLSGDVDPDRATAPGAVPDKPAA